MAATGNGNFIAELFIKTGSTKKLAIGKVGEKCAPSPVNGRHLPKDKTHFTVPGTQKKKISKKRKMWEKEKEAK